MLQPPTGGRRAPCGSTLLPRTGKADLEYLEISASAPAGVTVAHHLLHFAQDIYAEKVAFPEFMDIDYTRDPVTWADFCARMPAAGMGFYSTDAAYPQENEAFPYEIGAIRPAGICAVASAEDYEQHHLFRALQPHPLNLLLERYAIRGMLVPTYTGFYSSPAEDVKSLREPARAHHPGLFAIVEDLYQLVR